MIHNLIVISHSTDINENIYWLNIEIYIQNTHMQFWSTLSSLPRVSRDLKRIAKIHDVQPNLKKNCETRHNISCFSFFQILRTTIITFQCIFASIEIPANPGGEYIVVYKFSIRNVKGFGMKSPTVEIATCEGFD